MITISVYWFLFIVVGIYILGISVGSYLGKKIGRVEGYAQAKGIKKEQLRSTSVAH